MNRDTGKEKANQNYSRREFIKVGAFTVGAASALSICNWRRLKQQKNPRACLSQSPVINSIALRR